MDWDAMIDEMQRAERLARETQRLAGAAGDELSHVHAGGCAAAYADAAEALRRWRDGRPWREGYADVPEMRP